MQTDAIAGAILGCAVGDAIGLPYENLSRNRGVRLLGEPDRHRFLFNRGMVSDDTEHTCMAAQALCQSPTDPDQFAKRLGRHLKWWLLGVPAGVGFATLRATLRLWLGISPRRSGVFSAGNGPAMRSAILGAAIDDLGLLQRFVLSSTILTHSDPKAFHGAFAVALAAWCARRGVDRPDTFFKQYRSLHELNPPAEFADLMARVEVSLGRGESTEAFASQLGCANGVSGYVYHTVPVVLHAWLTHVSDFRKAIVTMVRCGGDTDTTAAILGAIIGSGVGRTRIPEDWLAGLWEWPRTVAWMETLASATANATATGLPTQPAGVVPLVGLLRNIIFFGVVVKHILRRLLPSY